jgi:UDP-N-acetylmuramoylalanine--D-glutamate ligase
VRRAVVVGLARTGEAVLARLAREGVTVVAGDDAGAPPPHRDGVEPLGPGGWEEAVAGADLVVPSPGVPPAHPALAVAARLGVPVRAEVDLAAGWARAPFVAVTGTNGKSTVTSLVAAMLAAAGARAEAVGNIGRPFLEAVDEPVDVLVVEVSSFQLAYTTAAFRPRVAIVLPIAPDHLDWHGSVDAYVAAKCRIFEHQGAGDLLVVAAGDGVAGTLRAPAPARTIAAGRAAGRDGYHLAGDRLVGHDGTVLATIDDLRRALPHDVDNALAAAAAARHMGAPAGAVRAALRDFAGLPHRLSLVGDAGGVRWYDDSKATNPHAALQAVRSFESVVLIAGGRNKGLDLSVLGEAAAHVRAVVALGEAAGEVAAAFEGRRPVVRAGSMEQAVRAAASLARSGDVVLLSPACASFDRYPSYAARGDDFASEVRALIGAEASA